ncbi:MAG: hypothetical protein RIQ60_3731 [Pseudomonadota bacterium]|jgi:uncharacterized surface protein with fasciclin (FAS1) repeats
MSSRRSTLSAATLLAASTLFLGLSGCSSLMKSGQPASVAGVLSSRPELSTLADLVHKSGLEPVLSAAGPFTIFAPTNEAFKAVPAKALQDLAANPAALKDVLSYHVVTSKLESAAIANSSLASVQGAKLTLAKAGSFVTVDEAIVTQADLPAGNGVVHVVDRVLMPPKK